jgi:hypothetical protein
LIPSQAIAIISAALADAKREALEEAAQIAEQTPGVIMLNAYDMRGAIVRAIRQRAQENPRG